MAGQPVKRGNWGDWAVIERSPRFKHNCCGGCVNYCYEDDSCNVFPIAGYEIGANFWRTCPKYCTKCHYIVKSQYIRYRSEQSNPLPQPALTSSMPKAHTRYKPNPSITVGMDVIDNEHNVGTVLSFDYKQNKICKISFRYYRIPIPECFHQSSVEKILQNNRSKPCNRLFS